MPVKNYQPTSPGRRGMSVLDFQEITRKRPEKSLTRGKRGSGGRDQRGHQTARNLPGVSVVRAEGLNVYDVLRHAKLLLTREAVAKVQERLAVAGREAAS